MSDGKPLDTRSLRLELTVPCDQQFRSMVGTMCERMARYVGYREAEAAELAGAVERAADSVLTHEDAPPYRSLDLRIVTSESEIEFRVRYMGEQGAGRGSVERLLSHRRGDEVPLEVMKRVMRRVEFGLDDGVEYCALSQVLPDDL